MLLCGLQLASNLAQVVFSFRLELFTFITSSLRVWTVVLCLRPVSHDRPHANPPFPQENKHSSRVRRTLVGAVWGLILCLQ